MRSLRYRVCSPQPSGVTSGQLATKTYTSLFRSGWSNMVKVFETEQAAMDFLMKLRTESDDDFSYSYKYLKVYNDKTKDFDSYVELQIT